MVCCNKMQRQHKFIKLSQNSQELNGDPHAYVVHHQGVETYSIEENALHDEDLSKFSAFPDHALLLHQTIDKISLQATLRT